LFENFAYILPITFSLVINWVRGFVIFSECWIMNCLWISGSVPGVLLHLIDIFCRSTGIAYSLKRGFILDGKRVSFIMKHSASV